MRKISFFLSISILYQLIAGSVCLPAQEKASPSFVRYLGAWGEKGSGPGQFHEPQGISVDPAGFLYFTDTGNQRIQKFNSMGVFISEIGGFGWGREQFDHPVGISSRNGLDVLVADHFNQRIERYDKDLHYLASFSSSEDWPEHLQFGFPLDVDLSSQGELFCLDGENNRILKLDVLGNPQLSFGDFDAGAGRLIKPIHITISHQGRVYVSDEDEGSVVVFDVHGNYLFHLGRSVLENPRGVTKMGSGEILVIDGERKGVFVFDEAGSILGNFGAGSGTAVSFGDPVDIACWRDRIYILDKKKNGVHVFQWIYGGEMNLR